MVLEGEIPGFSLLTIVVRGWGKHRTPHPLFLTPMENYDIYTSTTNREYKEQAEKAMKMYYDTFDEIETVRVSPTASICKEKA